MKNKFFFQKLHRYWIRLRLKPIRVFCFHQVSDEFDPDSMKQCDWMQVDAFKQRLLTLKKKNTFVSLEEAYRHVANDRCRLKHYAVLTADDGWASLKSILPWLDEQKIPVTLFLNPLYMDGKHFREQETERCQYPDPGQLLRSFAQRRGQRVSLAKEISIIYTGNAHGQHTRSKKKQRRQCPGIPQHLRDQRG